MEVAGTVGFCAGPPSERRGRFAACTATMLGTLLLSELWAPMIIGSLVASFLKMLQMHIVLQQHALDIIC